MSRILLVDLSSLFRPIWETSSKEADVDYASKATVARVHDMSHGFDHVAICCDSRKSWRKELAPSYKSQRPPAEEPMLHQLRLAKEQLAEDGFCVWEAEGFEADDVIASAVKLAEPHEVDVVIASSDKDLFQLVDSVTLVKSIRSGETYGSVEVLKKFGVPPERMNDWLCLVGDSSDNVAGVPGIGPKRATELLQKHGSLFDIYNKLGDSCTVLGLTPSIFSALKENVATVELARKLITLRTDVDLPFADIFQPRVPKTPPAQFKETEEDDMQTITTDGEIVEEKAEERPKSEPPPALEIAQPKPKTALVKVEWARSLEPANLTQAMALAKALHASRLFQAYGSPEAVLAVILAGRELGVPTMSALKGFHIIEGKPSMSADLMAALVKRSGLCKQFEIIERTLERATIRIWRVGEEKPLDVSYSVEDAKRAKTYKPGGNWEKDPAGMCVSRCKAIGARLKWEDVVGNVYTAEEMGREELESEAA